MELLSLKAEEKMLSKSELNFFTSAKNLRKAYLNALINKRLGFYCQGLFFQNKKKVRKNKKIQQNKTERRFALSCSKIV
jgi:hypothetical protein